MKRKQNWEKYNAY